MEYKIKKAKFIKSISDYTNDSYPHENVAEEDVKEICVVGRSNVGKSSFINTIANQKKLAKTSSEPGRTRLVNIFEFNDGEFYLVDLPGYGYARASKEDQKKWGVMIDNYLSISDRLFHVIMLVDLRHDPSDLDKTMINYLYNKQLPFTVIATKADKLGKNAVKQATRKMANSLAMGEKDVIPFSSHNGFNKDAIINRIGSIATFVPEILEEQDEERE